VPIVYEDVVRGRPRNAFELPSTRDEVLTETFAQAFEENPIMAFNRMRELTSDQSAGGRLDATTARQKLKDAGMESDIEVGENGIYANALNTLMSRKRIEKRRQETFALSDGGLGLTAQRFGLAALTSLSDPVSGLMNFVPVIGQARYARMLSGARSALGRAGVRASVGAAEGAAGAALLEPLIYGMRTQEQADYDAVDSLLNVTLGGLVGSGLHTTVGTVGELFGGFRRPGDDIPRDVSLAGSDRVFETRLAEKIGRDVDAAMREYAQVPESDGGRILNTDLARELSPDYRADRTRSAAVHEPSSWLVKQMYERKLQEAPGPGQDNVVLFTGGGTGSGKTTGLQIMGDAQARAQIVYDTNLNGLKSSVDKIDAALAAGKEVQIAYVWRDPVDALVNGALPRAERMGRTVPIDEHAKTHAEGSKTIKELATRYAGDDRVSINIIDNSQGKGRAQLADLGVIRDLEYNRTREDLKQALEAQRAAGRISEAVYRGTASTAEGRLRQGNGSEHQSGDGRQVTAAEAIAAAPAQVREAALRAATNASAMDDPVAVAKAFGLDDVRISADPDYAAAQRAAAELKPTPDTPDAVAQSLMESADLAEADARSLAQRLGIEFKDADIDDVAEAAAKGERWARAAELATVCLVRGG
jgi:hypothetical protein